MATQKQVPIAPTQIGARAIRTGLFMVVHTSGLKEPSIAVKPKGSTYPETNFEKQTSYREYISMSQQEDFMYVCIFEVAEEQLDIRRKDGNLASGQTL